MRASLIPGLLLGLVIGFLLSNQVATSHEDPGTIPGREKSGRYQIAGHSTYPPLLLDSETGNSWILMSTSDGDERDWVWEPIDMAAPQQSPSSGLGREVARMPTPQLQRQHRLTVAKPQSVPW